MNVRFARQARADVRNIVATISSENPNAARRVARLLSERALALAEYPERGTALGERSGVRRLVVRPYLIIYRLNSGVVDILRVLHGARNIDLVLRDLGRSDQSGEG